MHACTEPWRKPVAPGRLGRMSWGRKHSGCVHRFQLPRSHTCAHTNNPHTFLIRALVQTILTFLIRALEGGFNNTDLKVQGRIQDRSQDVKILAEAEKPHEAHAHLRHRSCIPARADLHVHA